MDNIKNFAFSPKNQVVKSSIQKDNISALNDMKFRSDLWKHYLINQTSNKNDELTILSTDLDLSNQNVIKTDCKRTRSLLFDDAQRSSLEYLLTYYCKMHKIKYKQGLNEVAAPFIYFRKEGLSISIIYALFKGFVENYLFTFYEDEEFLVLQCFLRFFDLLLKYHIPGFSNRLKKIEMPSELFATPWFLTIFASKMSLDLLYLFWDVLLVKKDPFFVIFFAISLIYKQKNELLQTEVSIFPQFLTNLNVKNETELKEVIIKAEEIRKNTPDSLFLQMKEHLLEPKETLLKKLSVLELKFCLSMEPMEIMRNLFQHEFDSLLKQDNLKKKNSFKDFQKYENSFPENSPLELIKNIKFLNNIFNDKSLNICVKNNFNFILIDLRAERNSGFLSKSHLISYLDNFSRFISNLNEMKGLYHFCLLVSDDENIEEIKIIEQFFDCFLENEFNYVSYAKGGFNKLHEIHMYYGLEIINHKDKNCNLCKKNEKKDNFFLKIFKNVFGKEKQNNEIDLNEEIIEENNENNQKDVPALTFEDLDCQEKIEQTDNLQENNQLNKNNFEYNNTEEIKNIIINQKNEKNVKFVKLPIKKASENQKNSAEIDEKPKIIDNIINSNLKIIENSFQNSQSFNENVEKKEILSLLYNFNNINAMIGEKKNSPVKNNKNTVFKKNIINQNILQFENYPIYKFKNKSSKTKIKIYKQDWIDLINFLNISNISYYICQEIKENKGKEKENCEGNYKYKETIIIVTPEFIFNFKFNPILKKIIDLILFLKQQKKEFEFIQPVQEILKSLNQQANNSEFFKIRSVFPLKTVFKISSKKFNSNILSFYYKVPKIENQTFGEYFDFVQNFNFKYLLNKNFLNLFHKLFKNWHLFLEEKNEIKLLFDFTKYNKSKECIAKVQKFYAASVKNE